MRKPKPYSIPLRERPFYACVNCIGGWKTVWRQREGFVPLPSVVRCSCWLSFQEALEAERGSK